MDNNLHDEIAALAYKLYEQSGRIEGRDLDNWLEADKIVRTRYAVKKLVKAIKSGGKEHAGPERRKHERVPVKGVRRNTSHSLSTKIIDISLGGVAIETTKKLQKNKEYVVEIKQKGNAHRIKGRVIWAILTRIEREKSGDVVAVYKACMKFQEPLFGIKL